MRIPWKIPPVRAFGRLQGLPCAALAVLGAMACVWLMTPGNLRAQEPGVEGRRVAEIRVVDASGQAIPGKQPEIPLEVNQPFDFASERESLRILYRTGNFSDIRVAVAPEGDALRVDFIARRNYYNNVVRIVGLKEPPPEPAALAALRLNLGEPFRESSLREALDRLQDLLTSEGLYQARVTSTVTPHEDTRQMDVVVTVESGPRARVGDVTIRNKTPYPDAAILRRSKLTQKTDITSAQFTRATQRLKKFLVDQGYLGAEALITPGAYDPAANRVPLTLEVTAGPRVHVEISGARIRQSRLRQLLPIYAEGAVDEDLLQEGRRNIRDYFQREGYFDVDVQVTSHNDAPQNQRVIQYEITRGNRFKLAGVDFSGNKYFSSELLRGRLQLQPAAFAFSGRFSQQLVREDTDSIRGLYLANGFRDAQVSSSLDDNYQGKNHNLFVWFHIVEGPQTRVSSLEIHGNHALSTDTILNVVGSSPGQPYSESGVASDRNNILAMYYNEGFPEAHFQDEVLPGEAANTVRVIYSISEGRQITVDKVLLTGFDYTKHGVVARQVQIHAGGPLREGDVVESQRRLYNLGVFNRVQIAPQNPDGTDTSKTMVVDVTEGKRYTIGYGFGFEVQRIGVNCTPSTTNPCNPNATKIAASPRGIFEISRSNMFGRAETLSFKVRASTLQYRSVVTYSAENFLSHRDLSLQLTGFADKSQDVQTFNSTRYEGAVQVVQSLSPSSSLLYRYFYRRVEASDVKVTQDEIPLLSQPTLVSGFGFTYARDHRDNPGDATRGTFNTVDLSDSITSLGSSASFFRGYFQNSSFHPFGRSFVFARSVRFGFETTYGNTVEPSDASCLPDPVTGKISCATIPLPERFFAGGGTSLRGFSLNSAGPRDPTTGFPVGGLAVLIFNQELHFPMKLPEIGNRLGGTLFYDAGNVFTDVHHISLAWKPSSATNLNYLSHTVGFGVRYPTPVGPVRVDFGYQLNSPLYMVTPATGPAQFFRVPHFQFFFNIGPIF